MDKKKILLVEDESSIADTIIFALNKEGYDTSWVTTGEDSVRSMEKTGFDLVIIDIGLPDMSGFDLIKLIRAKSQVPAFFLTARSEEIDKILGLELGADDYITKPFSPRELAARIKAHLRRVNSDKKGGDAGCKQRVFQIDDNKKIVVYCTKKLDLSRNEYKILCLLLSKPGWVFSREKILDMVWGSENDDVFDRTIDAHIKSIRAKLKSANSELDPIETHRGFGYSVKESVVG
jgi:two-component system, OmpR family, catabolic regulation response regulator CreB